MAVDPIINRGFKMETVADIEAKYRATMSDIEVKHSGNTPVVWDVSGVFTEIVAERTRQDEKWGGAEHDDAHKPHEWLNLVAQRLAMASDGWYGNYRQRMVQIAATAIAAVESFDRVGPMYPKLDITDDREIDGDKADFDSGLALAVRDEAVVRGINAGLKDLGVNEKL